MRFHTVNKNAGVHKKNQATGRRGVQQPVAGTRWELNFDENFFLVEYRHNAEPACNICQRITQRAVPVAQPGGEEISGGGSGGVNLDQAIKSVDSGVKGGTVGDLRMGEVETYDRSGKFTAEAARSAKALDGVISGYTPGLKDCFEQQLRRAAGLSGSVLIRFTIAPDGSVKDVNFTQSRWSDAGAGERVETCMKRKVQSWKFDPVDASLGDFKAGRKFTFGS